MSEKEFLETAFISMAKDELLSSAKQEALNSINAKRNATTEKPKKAMPTSADTKGLSESEIRDRALEDLRRQGLSFEVTQ